MIKSIRQSYEIVPLLCVEKILILVIYIFKNYYFENEVFGTMSHQC